MSNFPVSSFKNFKPNNETDFEYWLDQFNPKDKVVNGHGGKDDDVVRGIYYNKEDLRNLLYSIPNPDKKLKVALFPVTIKTVTRKLNIMDPSIPRVLDVVSYILIPFRDDKKLFYPDSKTLLVSDDGWPHKWRGA